MTKPSPTSLPARPVAAPRRRSRSARWLVLGCAIAMGLPPAWAPLVPAAVAQSRLPALGDEISDSFGVPTERKLGDQIMREIRADPDYLDDPVLLDQLLSIWNPLLEAARARGDIEPELEQQFAWEAFLVRDRSVNAFALPGGFVGVHLGLIAMTTSRDELAAVLAHEMSHVTQRHIARGITNNKRQSIVSVAAMILGVLAASRSNRADGANAVIAGGQALALQGQLNFSRDMEREADRLGFSVLTRAGFAASGMPSMFEKLDQSSRLNDGGGFPYLRSHPLTTERIGEARSRAGTAPAVRPAHVLAHAVMQGRARVLMDSRAVALRRWQSQTVDAAAPASEQMVVAYSKGLAASLLRDWPRADDAIGQAQALSREDTDAARFVGLLAVQTQLDRGNPDRARDALAPVLAAGATSRPVLLMAAQVALAGKDADALKRSIDDLQAWTSANPLDAAAWLALSRAWTQSGFKLRALRAEAESRVAVGDLTGAVDRLRAGQRLARGPKTTDFIEASVIDARLRDIERRRRAEERPDG